MHDESARWAQTTVLGTKLFSSDTTVMCRRFVADLRKTAGRNVIAFDSLLQSQQLSVRSVGLSTMSWHRRCMVLPLIRCFSSLQRNSQQSFIDHTRDRCHIEWNILIYKFVTNLSKYGRLSMS